MVGKTQISNKNKSTAFWLCLFFGLFGAHRFYVGKVGTGVFYFFTFGGFYIGWIVDLVMILCNRFKDKNGYIIKSEREKKKDFDKSGYTTTSAPNCNNLQKYVCREVIKKSCPSRLFFYTESMLKFWEKNYGK